MHQKRKAAVGFIFVTLFLDVMGLGLIIPVLPSLIASLKGVSVNEASSYGAVLIIAYSFTQFFCAPIMGNLSDRYGRRPVLLCSIFGFFIDYLLLAWAPTYAWLLLGRVLAGIAGSSFSTGSAYIADISDQQSRAKNFGMIGAAFGLGFILGPALGGLLAGWGIRAPFYAAAFLCLINGLYGFFVLPESLPIENRRTFDWKRVSPFGALKIFTSFPQVTNLGIVYFLIYMGAQAVQSTWSYFTIYRFSWSESKVGLSLAIVGILVAFVQSVLIRVINPHIGNKRSIYLGLSLYTLGLTLFVFAAQGWMMFLFLIPYCFGGIAMPSLQSILSGLLPANVQGELQGALTSIMSLTAMLGPLVMNNLFSYFTGPYRPVFFPGVAFFMGAIFMFSALIISKLTFQSANSR